jgi:4-hydroxy-2-oxoheptanedioate aldolase
MTGFSHSIRTLRTNNAKARLAAGQHVIALEGLNDADTIERLGPMNPHAVWLEGEHNLVSPPNIADMTRAADLANTTSIVRVNRVEEGLIYQALDLGAQGVAVPHVDTREDAETVVRAAKFSPLGKRGMYGSRQGLGDPDFFKKANDETMIIVFIEDVIALDNLDEILKVDHIDVFLVGPGDMSQSMGHLGDPFHPEVTRALEDAVRKIVAAGRTAGTVGNHDNVARYMELGARFFLTNPLPWIGAGYEDLRQRVGAER